jgi:2-methylcitrate dehydratase PrpD
MTAAGNPLDRLVHHVVDGRFEALPAGTVAAARTFVFDTLASGIAGSAGPTAREALAAARRWGHADESTVWVHGERLPAPSAAVVNAYQIHCLEFDCVHERAVLHPMSSLLGALLPEAERLGGVSGRRFVEAVVYGIDVTCSIGVAATGPMKFFRPSSVGVFGATAAVAKLRGFDADTCANALGLAYGLASGTLQPHVEGSRLLGLQVGFAARAAHTACDLAAAGVPGPRDVLTGPYGYLRLYEDAYDVEPALADLGRRWRIDEVGHKPFPSGRLTHHSIDALQQLQAAYGFAAAEVAAVRAVVPPLVNRLVGRPAVPSPQPNYAKLCLGYVAAVTLRRGTVVQSDFEPAALADPDTHALAARVQVETDDNPDPNAFGPQTVAVTLRDGRELACTVEHAIGDPRRPLPRDRQLEKFWRCWRGAARPLPEGAGERFVAACDSLEQLPDVRVLVARG